MATEDLLNYFDGNFDLPTGGGVIPAGITPIYQTLPRVVVTTAPTPTNGHWNATGFFMRAGAVITGFTFFTAGTALASGTHQWFALYDQNLALLCATADDTSGAWAANSAKRLVVATDAASNSITSFRTTYSGRYFLAVGIAATTVPTLVGKASAGSAIRTMQPYEYVNDNTSGVTAVPATLTQAASTNGMMPYGLVDGRFPTAINP